MKYITFLHEAEERFGVFVDHVVLDVREAHKLMLQETGRDDKQLPKKIISFLSEGEPSRRALHNLVTWFRAVDLPLHLRGIRIAYNAEEIKMLAPIPHPTSMRDGYAFRQHVEAARRNRGLEMIPEFDEIPIFYFTNHNAVIGEGNVEVMPQHLNQLDFELEAAIVIGKGGKNISAQRADEHVAGYMVMNDWSARGLQMLEMKMNLGPAKGKDFATAIGPCLVTRDELTDRRIETPNGEKYDLEMRAFVNGTQVSKGNLKDMTWTFAQIIERASYGVELYPGDVIGSGTCGTGCFLELNGSKVYDPPWWLKPGDEVVCEIDLLGKLSNVVKLVED